MIYLILTASLQNRIPSTVVEDRLARYRYAITESLKHVPEDVQPIIVENMNTGSDGVEGFRCHGKPVPVLYTANGLCPARNKGVNEWMDLLAVMERAIPGGMKNGDIIIKLTGRYCLLSSWFLDEVQRTKHEMDAWFRFLNVCTGKEDPEDCVLGCWAAKVSAICYLSPTWINLFDSPERAMAKHIRSSVSPERLLEMERLDVECVFSEDGRVLVV
jgi:hypothetical protein